MCESSANERIIMRNLYETSKFFFLNGSELSFKLNPEIFGTSDVNSEKPNGLMKIPWYFADAQDQLECEM